MSGARENISRLAIEISIICLETGVTLKTIKVTRKVAFVGRALIEAGKTGLTRKDFPGLALAHFIQMLREAGLTIHMEREDNSASWGGWHGRYTLMDNVEWRKIPITQTNKTPARAKQRSLNSKQSAGSECEGLNVLH